MYTILIILCNLTGPCDSHSAVAVFSNKVGVNAVQCLTIGQSFAAQLSTKYPGMKVHIECLSVDKEARMAIPFLANSTRLV